MTTNRKLVLAFSGGLDTSYCAAYLREQGYEVHTVTVQTGGFSTDELAAIELRAKALHVSSHTTIEATQEFVDQHVRYLLFANALRGDVYPLCVAAERTVQAARTAMHARRIGASTLAHGSTGAGNDQVRFDVAFRVLAPAMEILTPVREQALTRQATTDYLRQRGFEVPEKTTQYSINRGLWGTTIGGGPTHTWDGELPDDAYVMTAPQSLRPAQPETIMLQFDRGVPVALDEMPATMLSLLRELNERAGQHGIGRGMHVGDTILGFKGRVAFEAPAATVLIAAHRELEKLTLTRQQLFWKKTLSEVYTAAVHEAQYFEPLLRDIESFLDSSQKHVTGAVKLHLLNGHVRAIGATSPFALSNPTVAVYGEGASAWTGSEAAGFAKLYGLQQMLAANARERDPRP